MNFMHEWNLGWSQSSKCLVDREEERDLNDADKLRHSPTKTTVSS